LVSFSRRPQSLNSVPLSKVSVLRFVFGMRLSLAMASVVRSSARCFGKRNAIKYPLRLSTMVTIFTRLSRPMMVSPVSKTSSSFNYRWTFINPSFLGLFSRFFSDFGTTLPSILNVVLVLLCIYRWYWYLLVCLSSLVLLIFALVTDVL